MSKSKALIIVESPAKIKTLKKFLGSNYLFASSFGHVRDLPQKGFGIDVEKNFEPEYEILPDKKKVITELKKLAKECDVVYLSPDPDREGEAIAWHIASILPPKTEIKRTAFNAITKDAVLNALKNPHDIDISLVNAQQARRLLDRIVGYKISPLLSRKLQRRSGLSAGRVQSVALKLVVDREKEIEKFIPVEYWNIGAILKDPETKKEFLARLVAIHGKKVEKEKIDEKDCALINNEKTAQSIVEQLEKASFKVLKVEKKEKKRNPEPPFITSTLQQEASRHLRFSPVKTMSVAQSLYEGVDLDSEGAEGLITYMRTDSFRIEEEAILAARGFITTSFGDKYLPSSPRRYSAKKSAQDAHEAIRPTNLKHPPESIKNYLTKDQYVLYDLIWKRFIASQMNSAVYDTISADIETDVDMELKVTGASLKFPGFLAIYEEKKDEEEEEENQSLPVIKEGQDLTLIKISSDQAFTKPPPRFTEASLVKELEKSGIGRPSTYASIMQKIQRREYTIKENNRLKPTELGRVIAEFLESNFHLIMDISFTANMEDTLELVADGKKEWKEVIKEFWEKFVPTVETAQKSAFIPKVTTDLPCPKCGAPLQKIFSKSQYFYGCSKYPECDYRASLEELNFKKEDYNPDFNWNQKCPNCGKEMKVKHGKFGPFLGCSNYPECRGIINIPKKGEKEVASVPCPAIGCEGKIVSRRSRFGKVFFSCSNFPDCDVIVNDLDKLSEKYQNHPKTAYVKAKNGEKKKRAARGQFTLSPEFAEFLGEEKMYFGQIMKKVWEYIKANSLQDTSNKRKIIPDENLGKLLGTKETIDMFELPKLLAQHLKKH